MRRSEAFGHLPVHVFRQGGHTTFGCKPAKMRRRGTAHDLVANRVVHRQHLKNSGPARVPIFTPDTGFGVPAAAEPTEGPHEALGHDATQTTRHQMVRHPHMEKPGDGPGGVGRMNRGQHEVACNRCTHGDFRGFSIPDFTDHYDIGILPEDGAEGHGKGQPRERAHLDLIDAGNPVFHGVFDGDHVEPLLVQLGQSRKQAATLAASGGPGSEDHTLPCLAKSPYEGGVALGEAECVEVSRHP